MQFANCVALAARYVASWNSFLEGGQGQIMKGQNFFVCSNENEGMFVLVLQSYKLIYEFITGNKHEVLGSKAKLWDLCKAPTHQKQ